MHCAACHGEVEEFVWHENFNVQMIAKTRFECPVHGPVDQDTGFPVAAGGPEKGDEKE